MLTAESIHLWGEHFHAQENLIGDLVIRRGDSIGGGVVVLTIERDDRLKFDGGTLKDVMAIFMRGHIAGMAKGRAAVRSAIHKALEAQA